MQKCLVIPSRHGNAEFGMFGLESGARGGGNERMNRRRFLKCATTATIGLPAATVGYGLFEASWFRISRLTIGVPNLPEPFAGLTIAFLTDLHHGRYTSLHYIRTIVETTNSLRPNLVLLGGDYAHASKRYLPPCFEALSELRAPFGVYGVLGNHDHWYSASLARESMRRAHIAELTNSGCWLFFRGKRLRIAGVDDLWEGVQELDSALGDARRDDACILLSHNPDYVETLSVPRLGLVLSGPTHGGQVVLPGLYAPYVPSYYGTK